MGGRAAESTSFRTTATSKGSCSRRAPPHPALHYAQSPQPQAGGHTYFSCHCTFAHEAPPIGGFSSKKCVSSVCFPALTGASPSLQDRCALRPAPGGNSAEIS